MSHLIPVFQAPILKNFLIKRDFLVLLLHLQDICHFHKYNNLRISLIIKYFSIKLDNNNYSSSSNKQVLNYYHSNSSNNNCNNKMEEVSFQIRELSLGKSKLFLVFLAFIIELARCLVLVLSSKHRIKGNLKTNIRTFLLR